MEENVKSKGKKKLPADETETVADIFKRIDEIKLEIKEEVIEEQIRTRSYPPFYAEKIVKSKVSSIFV